jgi:hypothetical protein
MKGRCVRGLRLQDGAVLKNARLSRSREDCLTILHSRGGVTFKLADFTSASQAWLEGKHGRRSFDGGMHFATDEQYRLANKLIKGCSDRQRGDDGNPNCKRG